VLGVLEPKPTGWLIVGANPLAIVIAKHLVKTGYSAVLVDTNVRNTAIARREGLEAITANALDLDDDDDPRLYGVGAIIALTDNEDLNTLLCTHFKEENPGASLYRWARGTADENAARPGAGEVVWPELSLTALKAMTVEEIEKHVVRTRRKVERIRHRERVLLCFGPDQVETSLGQRTEGEADVLLYEPFSTGVAIRIEPDWVIYSDCRDMGELYAQMLCAMADKVEKIDRDAVYQQLLKQEDEYSSYIEYGMAMPHLYVKDLEQSVAAVAKLGHPVLDSRAQHEVQFVFLVLSPEGDPQHHLNALAEISRFFMDPENLSALEEAESAEDIREALHLVS
ncbi:MAG: PTS sugar transporter subunit IIA, partial [Planctomycetota bacterium]